MKMIDIKCAVVVPGGAVELDECDTAEKQAANFGIHLFQVEVSVWRTKDAMEEN